MRQIIKNKISDIDAEWAFGFLAWMFLALIITLVFVFIFSEKRVRGYYLSSSNTSAGIAYIITADIEWCEDRMAFSSPDPKLTMEVFKELQQISPMK